MKRVILALLLVAHLACVPSPQALAAAASEIKIVVDGKTLETDVSPLLQGNRVMVPLRAIFERLGATVDWNAKDRTITAQKDQSKLRLTIGSTVAMIIRTIPVLDEDLSTPIAEMSTETLVNLDVPPVVLNGRTLVPVRFVSEWLGSDVAWDSSNKTVSINSPSSGAPTDISAKYDEFEAWLMPESRRPAGKASGVVLILVNSNIYRSVRASLSTYTQDLRDEGISSEVYAVFGGYPVVVKQFIRKWYREKYSAVLSGQLSPGAYQDAAGVLMVGDLPIPKVRMRYGDSGDGTPYDITFPCDLYYTDLDGNWGYKDDRGVILISTVDRSFFPIDSECMPADGLSAYWTAAPKEGNAAARPEIFLGRISPSPVCRDSSGNVDRVRESAYVNEYFTRNHAYRRGLNPTVPVGRLLYYDNDWSGIAYDMVSAFPLSWPDGQTYPDDSGLFEGPQNRYVTQGDHTEPYDYFTRITTRPWLWVETMSHGWQAAQEFGRHVYRAQDDTYAWTSEGLINAPTLMAKDTTPYFYNLQGTAAGDYSATGSIAAAYLFTGRTLGVLGSTTGGPNDTRAMHSAIGKGYSVGQAIMFGQRVFARSDDWLPNVREDRSRIVSPKRLYGMTLLGDPTLKPQSGGKGQSTQSNDTSPVSAGLPAGAASSLDAVRMKQAVAARLTADRTGRGAPFFRFNSPGVDYLTVSQKPSLEPNWLSLTGFRQRERRPLETAPPPLVVEAPKGIGPVIVDKSYAVSLSPEVAVTRSGYTTSLVGRVSMTPVALPGQITESTPKPVAGEKVVLYLVEEGAAGIFWRNPQATVTTDSDGVFEFKVAPTVQLKYAVALKKGDADIAISNVVTVSAAYTLTLHLTLMPPSQTVVAGQMVTLAGYLTADSKDTESRTTSAPVPGRPVLICLAGGSVDDRRAVATDTTDRNGRFTGTFLPMTTGTYVAFLVDADREAIATSNTAVVTVTNR